MQDKNDKYLVYKNDLKYRKNRNLDINKIIFNSKEVQDLFETNLDTFEYRLKDCVIEHKTTLDLKELELTYFNISKIPQELINSIRNLFISDNTITKISDLSMFNKLEILDISRNDLKHLPLLPSSIIELNCEHNKLQDIKPLINCKKIERINVSNNLIEDLLTSGEFDKLNNLDILECSFNKLKYIPNILSLNKIVCNDNNITQIENSKKIKYIDCRNNNITQIGKFRKLKELYCNNNNINKIDYSENLEFIDCYNNNLNIIDYYPKLKELICDNRDDLVISDKYTIKECTIRKEKLFHCVMKV